MAWTLGPNYPEHAETRMIARPAIIRCSQCGAEKPSGRALCPCGAFAKPKMPRARRAPMVRGPQPGPGEMVPCGQCGTPHEYRMRCYVCLPRRWSREHASCQHCGRTDSPHAAHGLCRRCFQNQRQRAGYRPPSASRRRLNGPPRPVVDGVTCCRRCGEPVEPGQQCASCRQRAREQRRTTAIEEIRGTGNLGRLAV